MAAFFVGTYRHGIDEKGRTSIPSKFRQAVEENAGNKRLYLLPKEEHLEVYTSDLLEKITEGFDPQKLFDKKNLIEMREKARRYVELSFDKQGRISLPENFRQWFKDEEEVVFIGCFQIFEIWPSVSWSKNRAEGIEE